MDKTELINDLARAIAFLSRLPVPAKYFEGDNGRLDETSGMFVVAGCLMAVPAGTMAMILLYSGANSLLIIGIMLVIHSLVTGALHEDGLSDCADGFWGGHEKSKIFEIMRDSRLGTYGTLTLIYALALKFSALYILITSTDVFTFSTIFMAASGLSRGAMTWHWRQLPAARSDGIAASVGQPSDRAFGRIKISAAIVAIIPALLGVGLIELGCAILLALASILYFTRWTKGKIDGHTGDTIGASQQVSELVFLITLALWAH